MAMKDFMASLLDFITGLWEDVMTPNQATVKHKKKKKKKKEQVPNRASPDSIARGESSNALPKDKTPDAVINDNNSAIDKENKTLDSNSGINYKEAESTIADGGKTNFAQKFSSGGSGVRNLASAGPKAVANKVMERKPSPASLAEKLTPSDDTASKASKAAKDPSLVYLVRGKDRGRDAWHYVLVKKNLLPIFLKHTRGGTVDVAKFGVILFSGWGKDPPQDIIDKIDRGEY